MLLSPLTWVFELDLGHPLRLASYVAMGVYSFVFTGYLIRELLWGLALLGSRAVPMLPKDPGRRELLGRGLNLGVLGFAAAGSTAGYREAQQRARVVNVEIPVTDLPEALSRFRIVQVSDIHVGPTIDRGFVQAIADAVDTLGADLIAVTGDLVDGKVSRISRDVEPLGSMKSRYGTFVCTGNHEYYSGATEWIEEFRRLGMKVLINEHTIIEHRGRRLLIGGITDPQGTRFKESHVPDAKACAEGGADCDVKVLLAHRPGAVYAAAEAGFDLQLSGHTHGGQFFPWNLIVKLVHEFPAGLGRHDQTWVYTSRGTGYFGPPFRLGAPAEITVLELVPA